jgi:hypothetical protein
MQVPSKEHPIWKALITGQKTVDLKYLAAKIFIARARQAAQANPATIGKSGEELWNLYSQNPTLPSVQADLAAFGV